MLTIRRCKKILEDNSTKKYTDEEVKKIRVLLSTYSKIVTEAKRDKDETMERNESSSTQ